MRIQNLSSSAICTASCMYTIHDYRKGQLKGDKGTIFLLPERIDETGAEVYPRHHTNYDTYHCSQSIS